MIKKTITFENLDGEEVTEDLYFHLNKLEMLELNLELDGGLEDYIANISSSKNATEAYKLFKDVVLIAYGKRSLDGKRFIKKDVDGSPFKHELESSPALGELIFSFLQNPEEGAQFLEACLPAKLVAEAKAERAETLELPPGDISTNESAPTAPEGINYATLTQADIVEMSQEDFEKLDERKLSQTLLLAAFKRKNNEG